MIVAFDCATKTGWAIAENNGTVLESGVQNFTKKRGESNGLMFLKFRKWGLDLVKLAQDMKSDDDSMLIIVYEQAHHRGGAATEICVGLTTRCMEIASFFEVESMPVRTRELKMFATGKGTASKDAMIEASVKYLNRQPVDDNEADAVLLAQWAADNVTNLEI